ncbi:hypothetical protein PISL3812_08701 [Talaromyces islandicus]|uniref:Yeast cell wall synthesis Kre9/Knh1-like N-terminal domain-containing protein n=1 Tax=Talaromyces islandicus TaxID=28573 RepID=A0A0U1M9D9_TALIS|nr:hypothetical protein PISL3812_08701 [Talaromyces islandicus]
MAFTKVLIAGSAFFAAALAQGLSFTEWPTSVTAGQPSTLKWIGDGGAPVTLTLRKGASTDLENVEVISPDATNGEFTWTPNTDLENGSDYAVQISQGDQINYSGPISLGGGIDAPPPPASATSSAFGPQSDTADAAAAASSTTVASDAQSTTSGVDRAITTFAPSTDSAPDSDFDSDSDSDSDSDFDSDSDSASAADAAAASTISSPSGSSIGPQSTAQASETSHPSVVAHPSLMNKPFNAANDGPSATASATSSVHTGAAGRVTVPVALGVGSFVLLWFLQ